ncbi:MAG: DUF3052 domain-containing protein [Nocardioidaceae bacterium]|nr:DUF3052 domain-containing protein [Nocardioidaceae bacterium]NUS52128.1 DUF3052 domain-containing protein [Nocardioidaceae bacterium]
MTTPAGYSGKPLPAKLGLKPGHVVYVDGGPPHTDELLGGTPYTTRLPKRADVTLLFSTERSRLEKRLPLVVGRTVTDGMVWVCWPKKAAKVATDLDENVVRRIGLDLGVVDVKVAAVDQTWSGLKFVRRLADR